jgi:hypothetical protein
VEGAARGELGLGFEIEQRDANENVTTKWEVTSWWPDWWPAKPEGF